MEICWPKPGFPSLNMYRNSLGGCELEPDIFWQKLCQACQQLWSLPGVVKEDVAGVALTTHRSTVINLDKNGKPLRPAMIWLDNRRTYGLKPVSGIWGVLFALTGMARNHQLSAGRSGMQLDPHPAAGDLGENR